MALSRRLSVVAILGSCWFTAVACGDDDTTIPSGSDAGAGGEGGDGDNGSAGSKNTAGKAGMSTAGSAGTLNLGGNAGTAGTQSAGTAGVGSGDGGTAGSGDAGGAGGEDGTSPPLGGAGGDVGQAGAGATSAGGEGCAAVVVTELKACSDECLTDDDCSIVIPDNPPDTTYKCNVETKKCENPAEVCNIDADCVAFSWFFECDDTFPCFGDDEACISWQGRGWCASKPDPEDGCLTGGAPEVLPLLGGTGTAEVCVDRAWICGAKGKCETGCAEGLGCGDGKGSTCNETTHRCECASGTECASGVCGQDGSCAECSTDEHCAPKAAQTGHDVCVDGVCGCSGPNECPNVPFKNATTVCE
jgi:hypothetical protein